MRLDRIEVFHTRLKCIKPFRIATGVSDECHTLLVKIHSGCHNGYGEAVPKPTLTGETLEGCESALRNHLFPALKGMDCWAVEDLHATMDTVVSGYPAARAAIDMAIHDILGKAAGVPLWRFLGGSRRRVLTNYSIGLCPPHEAAAEGRRIVERGFKAVKLKVGESPDEDYERVRAVRSAIGPDIKLRIDANEGWSYTQAVRALRKMEHCDLELVEQPLPRWDLDGMARLRTKVHVPIIADESVRTPRDAVRIVELGAADGFNIKLMKCGGLHPAREIVAIARASGLDLMIGGMVGESKLSVTAAASLAAACGFEYADLDADMLLQDDLAPQAGLSLEGTDRVLEDMPGLGHGDLDRTLLRHTATGAPLAEPAPPAEEPVAVG